MSDLPDDAVKAARGRVADTAIALQNAMESITAGPRERAIADPSVVTPRRTLPGECEAERRLHDFADGSMAYLTCDILLADHVGLNHHDPVFGIWWIGCGLDEHGHADAGTVAAAGTLRTWPTVEQYIAEAIAEERERIHREAPAWQLGVADEREACARLAEQEADKTPCYECGSQAAYAVADLIRARSTP